MRLVLLGYYMFISVLVVMAISSLLGLLVLKVLKIRDESHRLYLVASTWVGYAFFISILMFINLFLPLKPTNTLLIFLILCGISAYVNKTLIQRIFREITLPRILYFQTVGILAFILVRSNFSGNYAFDMYNYHFQLIMQANNFPAVKGVINLFSHFGNTFLTTYHVAFLQFFTFQDNFGITLFSLTMFVVPYTIACFSFMTVSCFLYNHFQTVKTSAKLRFTVSFIVIGTLLFLIVPFTPPSIRWGTEGLRNHTPDMSYYILSFMFVLCFVEYNFHRSALTFFLVIIMACLLIFLKLSSVILALVIVLLTVFILWQEEKIDKHFWRSTLVAVAMFLPYIITNIIKSGTLFFPVTFTDLHLDWGNRNALTGYVEGVISWARNPAINELLHDIGRLWNVSWFSSWLTLYNDYIHQLTLCYGLTFAVFGGAVLWKRKSINSIILNYFFVSIGVWIPIFLFWFIMGPDIRFAGSLFLFPPILFLSLANAQYPLLSLLHKPKQLLTKSINRHGILHAIQSEKCVPVYCAFLIWSTAFYLYWFFIAPLYLPFWNFLTIGIYSLPTMLIGFILIAEKPIFGVENQAIVNICASKITHPLKKHIMIRPHIHTYHFVVVLLIFLSANRSALREGIRWAQIDNLPTPVSYNGVTVYQGKWDYKYLLGYSKNQPTTLGVDSNYTWIDSSCWYKGLVKKVN